MGSFSYRVIRCSASFLASNTNVIDKINAKPFDHKYITTTVITIKILVMIMFPHSNPYINDNFNKCYVSMSKLAFILLRLWCMNDDDTFKSTPLSYTPTTRGMKPGSNPTHRTSYIYMILRYLIDVHILEHKEGSSTDLHRHRINYFLQAKVSIHVYLNARLRLIKEKMNPITLMIT